MSATHRRLWRIAFGLYALVLFAATHKPGVTVDVVPGWRLDLFIHAGAFGAWAFLLGLTGWYDLSRPRGVAALLAIGIGYALFDEGTQAIPIFGRVFDPTDAVANVTGAVVGGLAAAFVGRAMARRGATPA